MTRFYERAMRGSGLRASQFNLLATLIQTGPIPATPLADFLGLERTTLARNLRPLLRDGHVIIEPGADRRVHKVAVTPKGVEAAGAAFPFWRKAQDAALARQAGQKFLARYVYMHFSREQQPCSKPSQPSP